MIGKIISWLSLYKIQLHRKKKQENSFKDFLYISENIIDSSTISYHDLK